MIASICPSCASRSCSSSNRASSSSLRKAISRWIKSMASSFSRSFSSFIICSSSSSRSNSCFSSTNCLIWVLTLSCSFLTASSCWRSRSLTTSLDPFSFSLATSFLRTPMIASLSSLSPEAAAVEPIPPSLISDSASFSSFS